MIALIILERLRRRVRDANAKSANAPNSHDRLDGSEAGLAPNLVPTTPADAGVGDTCQCGRYWLQPTSILQWKKNPATQALEFDGRDSILGMVTPMEKERWARGQQSRCSDKACPAFIVCANDAGNELGVGSEGPAAVSSDHNSLVR